MRKFFERLRAAFFFIIILAMMALCSIDLMKIQIVDGEEYLEKAKTTRQASQVITSPRGEIVDINGTEIVSNKTGFNVVIEKAFFPSDKAEMNRIICGIAKILADDGVAWIDTLPITAEKPYEYLDARDSDITRLRKNIGVQHYATAEDCLAEMYELYEIDDSYTEREKRIIAGIRYEMILRSFSLSNRYTFAEDIPMDTVVKLKEAAYTLEGMDIVEEAVRVYAAGDVAPHLIGTIGAISAEEYEEKRSEGYALNDVIGKAGIEKAMEDELRGEKGTRTLELLNGVVVSDMVTEEAVPGNTIQLTIDAEYQRDVQEILENHILWLNNQTSDKAKGTEADAGAIVVLNAKTGALLAAATSPTYDINDYLTDYASVVNGENAPLTNRATHGLYRPGSTFKTVTATAALNEGYIDRNSTIVCNNVYTYWDDYKPKCTGWHGRINVITAIEKSCNI
ncbi:MAG: penicillin-binding transpeptidase domain-containing protein, partial [Oscillospiraceae bacterium]